MCTPWYRDTDCSSVAGKLSGLAVGEGLQTAIRRRELELARGACARRGRGDIRELRNASTPNSPDPH